MKPTDFAKNLTDYLGAYLPGEKGVSHNTIKAYKDTFILFLRFMHTTKGKNANNLMLKDITQEIVIQFLDWLENERHCGIATRNARLATLHSFFNYLQYRLPVLLHEWQRILAIPIKKAEKPIRNHICLEGVKLLLSQPDPKTPMGLRDLTILSLLYDSGARVQELIDLTPSDINMSKPYYIKLKGKGNKKRLVPMRNEVMNILIEYMTINRMTEPYCCAYPLFSNSRREHFTRMGINNILQKYVIQAKLDRPDLFPEKVTPHILRHSKAMHLLQAGVNIVYIRDFLGHSSITTTEVYARADSKLKREALEKVHNLIPESKAEPALWLNDAGIMNWLKQMR